ncbi:UNVERIFIED_CONTAM: hypothetical protein RMT77_011147 [Armadillidium vulgare]
MKGEMKIFYAGFFCFQILRILGQTCDEADEKFCVGKSGCYCKGGKGCLKVPPGDAKTYLEINNSCNAIGATLIPYDFSTIEPIKQCATACNSSVNYPYVFCIEKFDERDCPCAHVHNSSYFKIVNDCNEVKDVRDICIFSC